MPDGGGAAPAMDEEVERPKKVPKISEPSFGSIPGTKLQRRYQKDLKPDDTLFFIEADSPSLMKRVVEVLLLQVNEINMEVNPEEGISIRGMESSQIALIDVNLSKRNFVTWNVNRPVSVGVNLQVMRDMLKSGQSDDFWRMYQYPDDEYIHMQIFSRRNSMAKLDFQWKSMDIDMENIEAPSELCAGEPSVVMASWRFKELMSEFKAMGDNLEVCLNPSHLTWHVTEPGKRVIDYWHDSRQDPEGSRVMISLGENDELRGWKKTFGLKHLDIFSRGSSLAGKIKIWLFHQHPACYHYDIEDDPTLGWARFWLAPFADSNVGGGNEGGG